MFTLVLNSAGHLLVDALCASLLFGPVAAAGDMALALPLYNTLAFSTQCAVGLATDALHCHERMAGGALLVVALALLLPLPWLPRVVIAGLGNSLFHVAGGTVTLLESEGRAGPLGVFVAPGAVGLALGTLFPAWGTYFAAAAILVCVPMAYKPKHTSARRRCSAQGAGSGQLVKTPWLVVGSLLLAVAVRAVGGSAVGFPWKTTAALSLLTVLCVFLGKALGGFLCDALGARKTALLSILPAAALTLLCSRWAAPSMAGQLLLNLSMPVTLWLLYRAMPDSPGLSFGLAASALWPGTLIGQLISLTGPAAFALTAFCFVFGLAAIIYSDSKTKEEHQ